MKNVMLLCGSLLLISGALAQEPSQRVKAGFGTKVLMFSSLSALDIAHLRLGVATLGLGLFLGVILLEVRELRATDLLRAIWRPATAAGRWP